MATLAILMSGYASSLVLGVAFGSREAVLGFAAASLLGLLIQGRTR